MIHPLLARLFPRPVLLHLRRSHASPLQPDNPTIERIVPLLALTVSCGGWVFADRVLAADPVPGIAAPIELAQASPTAVLRLNDSGDAVADLQQQLTRLGFFSDEITGFFGTATQAAVMQFQQAQGLTPDGIVGAATQAALGQDSLTAESASTPRNLLQLNDSGEQVAELQRRLMALGYYSGSASAVFDGATQFAVIQFQQANSLAADGVVGAETTAALRRASSGTSSGVNGGVSTGTVGQGPAPAPAIGSGSGNVLRLGASGMAVSTLQTQLQSLGFYVGPITGVYDAATQSAVTAFQQSRGLVADGIAGPQVNAALSSAAGVPGTIPGTVAPGNAVPGQGVSGTQAYSPAQMQYIQQMQQAQIAAEQARREAEQARLEAEKARLVYQQNLEEGRFSTVELQRQLQSNGYNPGDINGIMTPATEGAVSEAQRSYGLSESDFQGVGGMPLF